MLLGILTIAQTLLLIASLMLFDREIANPSFVYCSGFLLSAICAFLFASAWQFTLHLQTFFVILGGNACFIATCYVCKLLYRRRMAVEVRKPVCHRQNAQKAQPSFLPVCVPLIAAYLILGIVVISWTLVATAQLYPAESLSASIAARKYAATFTTDDGSFFFPLNQLRSLFSAAGYVVTYLVAQEFARKRLSKCMLLPISYVTLFAYMFTAGARTDIANNLAVLFICYLLIVIRGGEQDMRRFSKKTVVVLVCAIVAFLFGYQFLAIGRGPGSFSLDNLGAYLGAEISNLDTFLQTSGQQDTGIFGRMTFVRTINYLGGRLGIESWVYPLDLPYLTSNGHWMGNVYGTYYAFIYDFGYVGVPILTAIMAFISQAAYETTRKGLGSTFGNALFDIAYGYMACNLLFCFFSNRFYENVISINILRFITYVVVSLLFYLYVPKIAKAIHRGLPAKHLKAE